MVMAADLEVIGNERPLDLNCEANPKRIIEPNIVGTELYRLALDDFSDIRYI